MITPYRLFRYSYTSFSTNETRDNSIKNLPVKKISTALKLNIASVFTGLFQDVRIIGTYFCNAEN